MLRYFPNLRARLILLVLSAILPALALTLATALNQQAQSAASAQAEALRMVRAVSENQEQYIERTRNLLMALSWLPQIDGGDPQACGAFLEKLRSEYQIYSGFALANPQGEMLCSSPAAAGPMSFSGFSWFERILDSRAFVTSGYEHGPITGKAIIFLAYPGLDPSGNIHSILIAGLDLTWLNRMAAEIQLPVGSSVSVIDESGKILARYPEPDRWVGLEMPETPIVKQIILEKAEGTASTLGVDGVRRLYAYTPLGGRAEQETLYASVGIPVEIVYKDTLRAILTNLALLGLVTAFALVGVWKGSDIFLLRQMRKLVRATQRLAAGDTSARSELASETGEIGQLAAAFDSMAEAQELREVQLRQAEEKYRSLFDRVPVGLYRTTPDGKILDANPALMELLGFPDLQSLLYLNAGEVHADPQGRIQEQMVIEQEEVARGVQINLRRYDGKVIWVLDTVRVVRDADGEVLYYEGSLEDITERKRAEEALRELATRDELTGLFNRREMMRFLAEEVERHQRHLRPASLALLDIDHFKLVNDTYGHPAGDEVLRRFSQLICENLRSLDKPARYGGEEFAFILPETTEMEAFLLAERFRQIVETSTFNLSVEDGEPVDIQITVTIGVGEISEVLASREALITAVDQALYTGKRQGRNRTIRSSAKMVYS